MRRACACALVWRTPDLGSRCFLGNRNLSSSQTARTADGDDPLYEDLPKPRRRESDRKPYPTPMKVLIGRAKEEREDRKRRPCRMLEQAPENGLLVPDLVEVAHRVHQAWKSVLWGISRLVEAIPVQRCKYCSEVHVGHGGHEIRSCRGANSGFRSATHDWRKGGAGDVVDFPKCYHLYDRVLKPRVGHEERHRIARIPAILELCIQAGVDMEKYPCKRRRQAVYSIEGRIVDFEECELGGMEGGGGGGCGWKVEKEEEEMELRELGVKTGEEWEEMVGGAKRIMEVYRVQTCGYCREVQVGGKGHKVRGCRGSKMQGRKGLHAWQEARIEDVVPPNYVWHVPTRRDLEEEEEGAPSPSPLNNNLKRFYGKAPALVELCVQAGAPIPSHYKSMMRLDVVCPAPDEVDLVA